MTYLSQRPKGPHTPTNALTRLWVRLFPSRLEKQKAIVNEAYREAMARYGAAKRRGDTRAQHEANQALQAAMTERLRLEGMR